MTGEIVLTGNILDFKKGKIEPSKILIRNGKISDISRHDTKMNNFIFPGFTDSHVHIESSMLTPYNFSRIAVQHGTVATVSDPHEIANVLGLEGVFFMQKNAKETPFKFYFGAPSCVPATQFEDSGAEISSNEIELLFRSGYVKYLSEMMNYPGVISGDPIVIEKINISKRWGYPIDGHAPGVRGGKLKKYIETGITTDHECFTIDEAEEKIHKGMKILIREGSAAKNFDALHTLIDKYPGSVMLCSDDLHPDDLLKGHMNLLIKKSLEKGLDIFNIIQAVSYVPKEHYRLDTGLLQIGDFADLVMIDNLDTFSVLETYINGDMIFGQGKVAIKQKPQKRKNLFVLGTIDKNDLAVIPRSSKMKVIECQDGELITSGKIVKPKVLDNIVIADIENDILKIVVQNRYKYDKPSIGFIKGFGLKKGAIISSIAHDSHNIVAVGTSDTYLIELFKWIRENKGGIAVHDGEKVNGLPLPVAGIISDKPAEFVAHKYEQLDQLAKKCGSRLYAPFMTLSFMTLLVIPSLKMSNRGLFDSDNFLFTELFL